MHVFCDSGAIFVLEPSQIGRIVNLHRSAARRVNYKEVIHGLPRVNRGSRHLLHALLYLLRPCSHPGRAPWLSRRISIFRGALKLNLGHLKWK